MYNDWTHFELAILVLLVALPEGVQQTVPELDKGVHGHSVQICNY
jgi:hypothetical protein